MSYIFKHEKYNSICPSTMQGTGLCLFNFLSAIRGKIFLTILKKKKTFVKYKGNRHGVFLLCLFSYPMNSINFVN